MSDSSSLRVRDRLLHSFIEIMRSLASLAVLIFTLSIWGAGCHATGVLFEGGFISITFGVLIVPFYLIGGGFFYQFGISWLNPGWVGVSGGYDGLHWESPSSSIITPVSGSSSFFPLASITVMARSGQRLAQR